MKIAENRYIKELIELSDRVKQDHLSAYAAQASFFLILSAFPFLILVLTCIQYLPVTDMDLLEAMRYVLPSDVSKYFVTFVRDMIWRSNGRILSFSIIITIWSAAKGIMSISSGLNTVYRTNESRNYFVLRGIAMIHTLIVLVALVLLLTVFVFGNTIYHVIAQRFSALHEIATIVISMRVLIGCGLLFVMFVAMYRELANHKISIRKVAPGALFASVSWMTVSFLFSIYINHFGDFSKIYGSLTGLAISMIWIYMMMNLLLLGAELNAILIEKRGNEEEKIKKSVEN